MTSLEGAYDFNFSYPEAVRELENDRVKLVPFIVRGHANCAVLIPCAKVPMRFNEHF